MTRPFFDDDNFIVDALNRPGNRLIRTADDVSTAMWVARNRKPFRLRVPARADRADSDRLS